MREVKFRFYPRFLPGTESRSSYQHIEGKCYSKGKKANTHTHTHEHELSYPERYPTRVSSKSRRRREWMRGNRKGVISPLSTSFRRSREKEWLVT